MINSPKVSILVPVYGVEKFIERCVVSLLNQTFKDLEIIFINDCTLDNSIELIEKNLLNFPDRKSQVRIINHKVNKGLASARNTGVENALGDYILHVDSDDYLELNTIELLYDKAIADNSDMVICDFFMEWPSSILLIKQDFSSSKNELLELILSGQTMTCVWNKLIKRSLYISNNVEAIDGVNLGEDFTVVPKLVYFANKISKIDLPLYHYIQFNSNSYTKKVNQKYINNIEIVINSLEFFFKGVPKNETYLHSLTECKLRKKLELMLKVDEGLLEYVCGMYPESKVIETSIKLPFRDKVSLFVLNLQNLNILKVYLRCFNFVFSGYQKIKKR